jgi:hypothetical protein
MRSIPNRPICLKSRTEFLPDTAIADSSIAPLLIAITSIVIGFVSTGLNFFIKELGDFPNRCRKRRQELERELAKRNMVLLENALKWKDFRYEELDISLAELKRPDPQRQIPGRTDYWVDEVHLYTKDMLGIIRKLYRHDTLGMLLRIARYVLYFTIVIGFGLTILALVICFGPTILAHACESLGKAVFMSAIITVVIQLLTVGGANMAYGKLWDD